MTSARNSGLIRETLLGVGSAGRVTGVVRETLRSQEVADSVDGVTGTLELGGLPAAVIYGHVIAAATGSLVFTGQAAQVIEVRNVHARAGALEMFGFAGEVVGGTAILGVTGALEFTGNRGSLTVWTAVSQVAVLSLGEIAPEAHASQLAVMALGEISPPAHASGLTVLALAEVVPSSRISSAVLMVLADAEPCLTYRAQLWRIERRDGEVFTFTSHDRDMEWRGATYRTCHSLDPSASEAASSLGSVGNIELTGIISDDAITEEDLYGGLFDDAFVEVWLVSWNDSSDTPKRLAAGWTGELSQGETGFKLEVVGPGARLDQQALVQSYTPGCRRVFGSPQAELPPSGCGVDLEALKTVGVTQAATTRGSFMADIDAPPMPTAQWPNGKVTWTSGRNAGLTQEVKTVDFATGVIVLWVPTAFLPEYGDTFDLFPGCDKAKTGGCTLYNNVVNFGGFADVPGPDALMETPDAKY